jgi:hypothetical protein
MKRLEYSCGNRRTMNQGATLVVGRRFVLLLLLSVVGSAQSHVLTFPLAFLQTPYVYRVNNY